MSPTRTYRQLRAEMTLSEKASLMSGANFWNTKPVERLGIPSIMLTDGPHGLRKQGGAADHLGLNASLPATCFPPASTLANSWDEQLLECVGAALGAEAAAEQVSVLLGPGLNIKRNPLAGRNFEYFSEDPLVSGRMSAAMVAGAQSKHVLTFMKHFALNEQEINARVPGVNVFATEQAMREVYLRPFEITVKEGGATGAMTSFINIGGRWAGGNEQLLQGVLRGEWGFDGVVSTDAVVGGFMDPALAVRYGNDLMLAPLANLTVSATQKAYAADPVGVGQGLRERVHAVAFALLRTDLFD